MNIEKKKKRKNKWFDCNYFCTTAKPYEIVQGENIYFFMSESYDDQKGEKNHPLLLFLSPESLFMSQILPYSSDIKGNILSV